MARATINLLIGGEAGQGLATVSQGLSKALVRGGWHLVMTQSYHSRIRGGHNTMAIRMSSEDICAPAEAVDILVALNQEALDLHLGEMSGQSLVITGPDLDPKDAPALVVPFEELAPGRFGNVAALGVASALLGLDESLVQGVIKSMFGKKSEEVAQKNAEALAKAFEWAAGQDADCEPLAKPARAKARMLMAGNEAIALGAISAGTKFLSFYPMTPGTSIALNFIAQSHAMGLVAEQAEDEIAAITWRWGPPMPEPRPWCPPAAAVSRSCVKGSAFRPCWKPRWWWRWSSGRGRPPVSPPAPNRAIWRWCCTRATANSPVPSLRRAT